MVTSFVKEKVTLMVELVMDPFLEYLKCTKIQIISDQNRKIKVQKLKLADK